VSVLFFVWLLGWVGASRVRLLAHEQAIAVWVIANVPAESRTAV
jgi:hypothetical protein